MAGIADWTADLKNVNKHDITGEMDDQKASTSRAFPLIAATIALLYNLTLAVLCGFLPRDSVVVGYGASGYATAGAALSLLGIYGIVTRRSHLISIFSHFLLVDTVICAIVRLILLEIFFNAIHSQDTCSDLIEAVWTRKQQPSYETISSPGWQQSLLDAGVWCRFALGAVHIVSLGLLVCTSAAQGTVALAIRSFGKHVEEQAWEGKHGIVEVIGADVDADADTKISEKV